jgi:hypothetical protein
MLDSLGKGATSISTERVLPIHSGQTPSLYGRNRIQGSLLPAKPLVRMEEALDDAAGDLKLRDVANATQADQPSRPPA